MNTSDTTHEDERGENSPERTDGGYEQPDNGAGNPLTRRLRSAGILPELTVEEQRFTGSVADEDLPVIVRWHEIIRQGR